MALAEKGVEVRLINIEQLGGIREIDVLGQVDENTALVALASCHFISGWRIDCRGDRQGTCASGGFSSASTPSRRWVRFR